MRSVARRLAPSRRAKPPAHEPSQQSRPARKGKRRRRGGLTAAWLVLPAATVMVGLILKLLQVEVGIVLVVLGLGGFVVAAWLAARPEEGGDVGRPDITPWSVG